MSNTSGLIEITEEDFPTRRYYRIDAEPERQLTTTGVGGAMIRFKIVVAN